MKMCSCRFVDAWRCARDRWLYRILCPCSCHSRETKRGSFERWKK